VRVAPAVVPTEDQRLQLERYARGRSVAVRVAQRAMMLLLAAERQQDKEVAQQLGYEATPETPHGQPIELTASESYRRRCRSSPKTAS